MKYKIVIITALLLLVGVFAAGCGNSVTQTTSPMTTSLSNVNSVSTNAINGLSLSLSLDGTTYKPSQLVSIILDETNMLLTTNNVPVADNLPSKELISGFTNEPSLFPFGLAILRGNYTSSNYSTAKPLIIYDPIKGYIGTQVVGPTSYVFQPSSDIANLVGGNYNSNNGLKMQYKISVDRYWPNNKSTQYTKFSPGVYTVVAGDEWGALLVLHFTVSY